MNEPLAKLELRLCPLCEGAEVQVGACSLCEGAGVLDQSDRPFVAPAPFDHWTPAQLVKLSRAASERDKEHAARHPFSTARRFRLSTKSTGEPVVAEERPRRLTLSEILELLLTRNATDHSTVKLTRNAKGETQVEVSVRTGEPGLETVEQARAKAEATYNHLCELYPVSRP